MAEIMDGSKSPVAQGTKKKSLLFLSCLSSKGHKYFSSILKPKEWLAQVFLLASWLGRHLNPDVLSPSPNLWTVQYVVFLSCFYVFRNDVSTSTGDCARDHLEFGPNFAQMPEHPQWFINVTSRHSGSDSSMLRCCQSAPPISCHSLPASQLNRKVPASSRGYPSTSKDLVRQPECSLCGVWNSSVNSVTVPSI